MARSRSGQSYGAQNRFIQKRPENHQTLTESIVAILLFFLFARFIHKNDRTQHQANLYAKHYSQTPRPISDERYNQIICKRRAALISGMHLSTGLMAILLLTCLITTIWVMADYAPENWIGTATLLLILSSGETKAMGHISQRIAFFMVDFTAQPLASTVQKSLKTARKWMPAWLQKPGFDSFMPVANIIRVALFVVLTIAVFALILAMGALLFFAPIVYFSVNLADLIDKAVFIISYTGLLFGSYGYWYCCSKKLWTNNLSRPMPVLRWFKRYRCPPQSSTKRVSSPVIKDNESLT